MRVLGVSVPVCECPHLDAPVCLTCVPPLALPYKRTSARTPHGRPAYWPPLEHAPVRAGVRSQLSVFHVNPCDLCPQTSPVKLGCSSSRDPHPNRSVLTILSILILALPMVPFSDFLSLLSALPRWPRSYLARTNGWSSLLCSFCLQVLGDLRAMGAAKWVDRGHLCFSAMEKKTTPLAACCSRLSVE